MRLSLTYTFIVKCDIMSVKSNSICTIKCYVLPIFIALQVTSKKRVIRYNLPIQIGVWVYQYAKLRMLNFFYDVIDHFIPRQDYNMLEMDTGL